MATNYWLGTATAVAQVARVTFGTYDAATTRSIVIGNQTVSAVDAGGSLINALTNFAIALNASTHVYFSGITWTSDATHIIGTADVSGVEFTFSGAVSGGTGTYGGYSVTTANAGPSDWSTASNWSLAAAPVSTNDVVIRDSSVNICFGLAQSAVVLNSLKIEKTYTGKIGLDRTVFVTGVNGATTSVATEYRNKYLAISATTCNIGEYYGQGTASGSGRIMIDFGTDITSVHVYDTASASSDTSRPAVRLKFNKNTSTLNVISARGGVGVGVDTPGETSSLAEVNVSDESSVTSVWIGTAVTLPTLTILGGVVACESAVTTVINMFGGTLSLNGKFIVANIYQYGGIIYSNNESGGSSISTALKISGGTFDTTQSRTARTITLLDLGAVQTNSGLADEDIVMKYDYSVMTFSSVNWPGSQVQMTIVKA